MHTTGASPKGRIWNIPNVLTFFRIALIVPFLLLMYREQTDPASWANYWACLLFFIASMTDWVDGVLARRWNLVTPVGQLLDPLADKLLVAAALVMLAVFNGLAGGTVGAPAWVGIFIIARELAVTGLRGMAGAEGVVIAASSGGKWKTVIQLLALGGLIMQGMRAGDAAIPLPGFALDLGLIGYYGLFAALALTAWSGAIYFVRFLRAFA